MNRTNGCALFIDHENIMLSLRGIKRDPIPGRLASALKLAAAAHGPLIMAEAFANWTRFEGQDAYDTAGITPIFAGGAKNSADVRMAARALDANANTAIRTIILATGDRDLLPVVKKIRESGRVVVVWAVAPTVSGQMKDVADHLRLVEDILGEVDRAGHRASAAPPPPTAPGRDRRRFSVTELKTYEDCPHQWYLRFIRGIKTPPTPEGFVGQHVHHALRDFMLLAPAERTMERLEEQLRLHWKGDASRQRCFCGDRAEEARHGRRAIKLLEDFFAGADLAVVPRKVEVFLESALTPGSGGKAPGGFPPDVVLTGKVDRVDDLPDGRLVIIDYKTGRLPASDEYLRRDMQVAVYWALVERQLGAPVAAFKFLGLEEYRELEVAPSPAERDAALNRAGETIAMVRSDPNPMPKVGPLCPWCGYLQQCPAREEAQRVVRPADPGELPF